MIKVEQLVKLNSPTQNIANSGNRTNPIKATNTDPEQVVITVL